MNKTGLAYQKGNRIQEKFRQLLRQKKKALIAFITAGDPKLAVTEKLALEFSMIGVDILELGVPFSDPLADGPTIQAASQRALKNKINLIDLFELVRRLRRKTQLPIALMTYYNIVFHFGIKRFIQQARGAGVDGVIIPDLPVEEAKDLIGLARRYKLATIFLLAPTSDAQRIKKVASCSTGFIYYVSLTGTTGARRTLAADLFSQLRQIRKFTSKPICVGFGVSNPKQAALIARSVDGVIVGSAIVKIVEKNLGKKDLVAKVTKFVHKLREAL